MIFLVHLQDKYLKPHFSIGIIALFWRKTMPTTLTGPCAGLKNLGMGGVPAQGDGALRSLVMERQRR
jgi:hypothetical protein